MRKAKSILAQLGVKSLKTISHGEISLTRAIQACALSAVLATGITHYGQHREPDYTQAMNAVGQTTYFDPHMGSGSFLALALDTSTGETGYVNAATYKLNDEFRKDLESEINAIIAQAEVAGSWDLYIGSRLTCLYMSETPEERQLANAVLGYVAQHTGHAPGDLPSAAYYTRTNAVAIESSRQVFAMADVMSEALITDGKTRITRASAEAALARITDEPDAFIAAFNVAVGTTANQQGAMDILPIVEMAIQIEENQLSMTSMSGQMFGISEVAEVPAATALILTRRVGRAIHVRTHTGSFSEHYRAENTEPTAETLNSQIKTGFDLSEGLSIEGRGVLLSRIPMPGEDHLRLPDFRYDLREVNQMSNLEIVESIVPEDSFKLSM